MVDVLHESLCDWPASVQKLDECLVDTVTYEPIQPENQFIYDQSKNDKLQ
jgi:hypothetical protein